MSKLAILDYLEEFGPTTSLELAEQLGISRSYARACVSYCKKTKRIYVHSYTRDEMSDRLYPRARYAAGNLPDAKKPKPLPEKEYRKRYRSKKSTFVSSVFNLGTSVEARRTTTRRRPDIRTKNAKIAQSVETV